MDVITVALLAIAAWITISWTVAALCSVASRADEDDERFYAALS